MSTKETRLLRQHDLADKRARFVIVELGMKPNEPQDPTIPPAPTRGPLTDLVDDKLSNSLADQIAEELEKKRETPARSGATDYAHGTAEHEDDRET